MYTLLKEKSHILHSLLASLAAILWLPEEIEEKFAVFRFGFGLSTPSELCRKIESFCYILRIKKYLSKEGKRKSIKFVFFRLIWKSGLVSYLYCRVVAGKIEWEFKPVLAKQIDCFEKLLYIMHLRK